MSYALWLVGFYILGGLTLVPAVGLGVFIFLYWYLPRTEPLKLSRLISSEDAIVNELLDDNKDSFRFPHTEKSSAHSHSLHNSSNSSFSSVSSLASTPSLSIEREIETGVEAHITGWLTISKSYFVYPNGAINNATSLNTDTQVSLGESAYTALYRRMRRFSNSSSSTLVQSPEEPAEPTQKSNVKRPKTAKYFAVLRHGNLFLYNDSDQKDLKQVIVIANHVVTIWPPNLPDGELFGKRNSICLVKLPGGEPNLPDFKLAEMLSDPSSPPKNSFYLYSDLSSEKEDFYFALIRASKTHSIHAPPTDPNARASLFNPVYMAHPLHYKTPDMMDLIQTLHSTDSNIQTRWLNALLGRLFLSFKDTGSFEDFFRKRIVTKLSRSKRPSFLSEIKVTSISSGNSIPFFTNPHLVELTPEGKLSLNVDIAYNGNFSVEVTTNAMINLGSRFKTREVPINLLITLQRLEGKLVFRMKPPPSNRLWYSFEGSPKV